jgi:hypothetical protein
MCYILYNNPINFILLSAELQKVCLLIGIFLQGILFIVIKILI